MSPGKVAEGAQRGWIVPIGGAEEKEHEPEILQRFVELCGGDDADIVVIPTASTLADTGPRYVELFSSMGALRVDSLDFDTRRDAQEANRLRRLGEATGIFLTGGNQVRIATMLGGTPVARMIRDRNAQGVVVGGTSAGASILSEHMIASGNGGRWPTADSVNLSPGLGLTNRVIIDQHFRQRGRLGRLLAALAYNPFLIGVGLDEDTAIMIGPDNVIEVVGSGGVTIIDAGNLQFSSMAQARSTDSVCMLGVTLHVLVAGAKYNLNTRSASAGSLAVSKSTA